MTIRLHVFGSHKQKGIVIFKKSPLKRHRTVMYSSHLVPSLSVINFLFPFLKAILSWCPSLKLSRLEKKQH